MSSWRSGRGPQWQPVKLWWTPCPRGLRQCWKIMVATQNIDTFGPIWTFFVRGVLTFVASGLDINGCVLSYFEGTANLHLFVTWKGIIKYLQKMWGVYLLLWDIVYIVKRNYLASSFFLFVAMHYGIVFYGKETCIMVSSSMERKHAMLP